MWLSNEQPYIFHTTGTILQNPKAAFLPLTENALVES